MTNQAETVTKESAQQPSVALSSSRFPVVGIVGAEGSRQALRLLFRNLPEDSGMAFILVTRMASRYIQMLPTFLQEQTNMPIVMADDGVLVQRDHVYIAPIGKQIRMDEGRICVESPVEMQNAESTSGVLDTFLFALAKCYAEDAVAILLSGTGRDGVDGLVQVKAAGGLVMIQHPDEAAHPALPRRAMVACPNCLVATAGEMVRQLVQVRGDLADQSATFKLQASEPVDELYAAILQQIFRHTGHDLSHYKVSTLHRRIASRMAMVGTASLTRYVELLKNSVEEATALFRSSLVSVTSFFRDPDAHEMLGNDCIPQLFAEKKRNDTVRVWVAGCATGQEAYSIAIHLAEYAEQMEEAPRLQVFATDLDEEAIAIARRGVYPKTIAKEMSSGRLERFFTAQEDGYQVRAEIREHVLFAVHDLFKDPPFSRLDLISCRNVLIYFNRVAQGKLLEIFHYALNPQPDLIRSKSGPARKYLFLGTSESVDAAPEFFSVLDKQCHLYLRKEGVVTTQRRLPTTLLPSASDRLVDRIRQTKTSAKPTIEELYTNWSLRVHLPPRLLVNSSYEITHLFGAVAPYLHYPGGAVTQNILQRIRPELLLDVRSALYQAFNKGERSFTRMLRLEDKDATHLVRLHVGPITEPGFPEGYAEILFVAEGEREGEEFATDLAVENDLVLVRRLEEELTRTRERLQRVIEEYDDSDQELKVANQELQSVNEELKSTTEELETSQEELQSMNEELITVNSDLLEKIDELHRINGDLNNLIASTDVGTLFLDTGLRVKRFTPRATDLFNLLEADMGRPFAHVTHRIRHANLSALATRVEEQGTRVEETVQRDDGHWYSLRMFPYRTVDGEREGVVITFVDINDLKRAESEERQRIQQQMLAQLGRHALEEANLDNLIFSTIQQVAVVLEMEMCKLLQIQPNGGPLLLRAGVGWQDERIGVATVPSNTTSQAGYTLRSAGPVVVRDFETETRFLRSPLLTDHDVRSGISVTLYGPDGPYGVLSFHSRTPRAFATYDVDFVQSVANTLAAAIARQQAMDKLRASEADAQRYVEMIQAAYDSIIVWSPKQGIEFWNQGAEALYGYRADEAIGQATHQLLATIHPQPVNEILQILEQSGVWEGELVHTTKAGQTVIVSTRHQLVRGQQGDSAILEINRDITERKQSEADQQLLTSVAEKIRLTNDAETLLQETVRLIGEHLQVGRCLLIELDLEQDRGFIRSQHCRGLSPVATEYQQSDYSPITQAELQAGRVLVNHDAKLDPRTAAHYDAVYAPVEERAYIGVPLYHEGRWRGILSVTSPTPRQWQPREVSLLESVGERLWLAVEKLRLNASLRSREAQLQLATMVAKLGIAEVDYVTNHVHLDAEAAKLFGVANEAITLPRADLHEVVHPEDRTKLWNRIHQSLETQSNGELAMEHRVVWPDGQVRWLSVRERIFFSYPLDAPAHPIHSLLVVADITERKQAEETLRRQEAFIREIADNVPGLVGYMGADESYRFANAAFESWFQLPRQQILEGTALMLLGQDDYSRLNSYRQRALAGEIMSFEETLTYPDGITRNFWARYQPDFAADGSVLGFYIFVMDVSAQREAQAALRASEAQLNAILQNVPAAVYMLTPDHHYLYVNRHYEQENQISNAEIRGLSVYDRFPREVADALAANERQVLERKVPVEWEESAPRPDGIHHYATVKTPLLQPNGEPYAILGVSLDITERKRAEAALRISQERLEIAAEAAELGVFEVDLRQGTALWENERMYEIFGHTQADGVLTQATFFNAYIHPDDAEAVQQALQEANTPGAKFHVVCRLRRKAEREFRWVEATAKCRVSEDGISLKLVGVVADITERKETEKALNESLSRLDTILQNVPASVYMLTPDQRYLYVNRHYEQLAHVTNAEIQGKSIYDMFPSEVAETLTANDRLAIAAKAPIEIEESAPEQGEMHIYATVKVPLLDAEGEPYALLGISTDITERKRSERVQQFLLDLDTQTRLLEDADAILAKAAEHLGQYLEVTHCTFNEVDLASDRGIVLTHWRQSDALPLMLGTHQLSSAMGTAMTDLMVSGQSVAVSDVLEDSHTAWLAERYRTIGVQSLVRVPFHLKGSLVAMLAVADSRPRLWRQDEIALLETVIAHVWPLVVKARAEKALYESQRFTQTIIDTSPTVIYIHDLVTLQNIFTSPWAAQALGYTQAEFQAIGPDLIQRIMHPEDQVAMGEHFQRVRAESEGDVLTVEYRMRHKNGSWRWFLSHDTVFQRSATGAPAQMLGVAVDITERKQAEETLRLSAERLNLATQAGGVGIFDHDLLANRTEFSEIYAHITGFPLGGLLTREAWLALVHPEDRSLVDTIWNESQRTGNSYYYECRIMRPDGTLIWAEVNALLTRDETGRSIRITGAVRDITERKQTALHQQFLLDLNSTLRSLNDPTVIQQTVVNRLGEYLGVSRCRFNTVDLVADKAMLLASWSQPGLAPAQDIAPLSRFASPAYIASAKAGRTLVVDDANLDVRPELQPAHFRDRGFPATIRVPCLRNREWVASLHVLQDQPRHWRSDEVQLVESVVHHFWPLVEKARIEDALRESEARFRNMADTAPAMLWVTDPTGECTFLSRGWYEYTGQDEEKGLGRGWNDALHPEDREKVFDAFLAANQAQESFSMDYRLGRADGSYCWAVDTGRPRFGSDGSFLGFIGAVIDIHDRKEAEEALRRSEERYRYLFETMDEGFCVVELIFDEQGKPVDYHFLEANPAFEEFTGLHQAVGRTARELVPDLEANWWETYGQVALSGEPIRFEQGSEAMERWFSVYAFRVGGEGSRRVAILFNNITERKQSELSLARNNAILSGILESSSDAIFVRDLTGRYLLINNAGAEQVGLSKESMVGKRFQELFPADAAAIERDDRPIFEQGQVLETEQVSEQNGEVRYWNTLKMPLRTPDGRIIGLVSSARDMTERKQAEDELRRAYEVLSLAQRISQSGVWDWDIAHNHDFWSPEYYALYGIPTQTAASHEAWIATIHPDDRARIVKRQQEVLQNEGVWQEEFRILHPERGERWLLGIGQVAYDDAGKAARFTGINLDISERKAAEAVLARYQLLSEQTRDIILFVGQDGKIVEANAAAVEAYGYDRQTLLRMNISDLRHPATRMKIVEQMAQASQEREGHGVRFETVHLRQDGSSFPVEVSSVGTKVAGEELLLSVIRDISERKAAEAALAASEAKFSTAFSLSPLMLTMTSLADGRLTEVNENFVRTTGYTRAESLGRTPDELGAWVNPEERQRALARLSVGKTVQDVESLFRMKNGELRTFLLSATVVEINEQPCVLTAMTNITERKAAEAQLQYQAFLLENVGDAIISLDMDLRLRSWNRGAEEIYGWSAGEVIGQVARDLLRTRYPEGDTSTEEVVQQLIREGRWQGEVIHTHKNGNKLYISNTTTLLRDEAGNPTGVVAVNRDITARKQAEERLRFMADASSLLASSLDYRLTLENVAHAAVPAVADWCVIDLLTSDGTIVDAALAHIDPEKVSWAKTLRQRYPVDPETPAGAPNVIRTGKSEFYPDISDAMLSAVAKNEEELNLLRTVGYRSIMIVPLRSHDRILGAISFVVSESERMFTADDLQMAEDLALRAASAIENAQLYQAVQQNESELRVSEERFRSAFEQAAVGMAHLNTDGYYLRVNDRLCEILGYSRQALLQMNYMDVTHADDLAADLNQAKRLLAGEIMHYSMEKRYIRQDSSAIWSNITVSAVRDDQNNVKYTIVVVEDISARKAAEEAVRQSEELARQRLVELEAIYNTAPIGLCVLDRNLRWQRINKYLAEINGYSVAEHLGRTVGELLPDVAPTVEPIMRAILETGEPVLNFELQGETAAQPGVKRNWLEHWFPLQDRDGIITGINIVAEEITERKRQERHQQFLSELGLQLRLLSDSDAILKHLVSRLGEYLQVTHCRVNEIDLANDQFIVQKNWTSNGESTYGAFPITELAPPQILSELQVGQTVIVDNTATDPRTASVVEKYRSQQIDALVGVPIFHEGQWWATLSVREQGERHWRADEIALLETVSNQLRDLLEKVRAEEALVRLNATLEQRVAERTAELERSNRELDQFAYVASHDLKAPLRAIDHLASWISEDAEPLLPPDSVAHLRKLRGRVQRMEKLLEDLLIYSRANRVRGTLSTVNLGAVVDDVIELLAPPDSFKVSRSAEMPTLTTYRAPLELVLRNLISNAIKHHHLQMGEIHISVEDQGDFMEVTVRDDGPGIAPEFYERIFGMFQTLRPRDEVEASGIGLAVVKRTIESLGGKVWVESVPGKGSIFHFTWPKKIEGL